MWLSKIINACPNTSECMYFKKTSFCNNYSLFYVWYITKFRVFLDAIQKQYRLTEISKYFQSICCKVFPSFLFKGHLNKVFVIDIQIWDSFFKYSFPIDRDNIHLPRRDCQQDIQIFKYSNNQIFKYSFPIKRDNIHLPRRDCQQDSQNIETFCRNLRKSLHFRVSQAMAGISALQSMLMALKTL